MSMTVMIGLGTAVWVLIAILVALIVARMIRLRERQRPHQTIPAARAKGGFGTVVKRLHTPSSSGPRKGT